jgi:hypothetical protein
MNNKVSTFHKSLLASLFLFLMVLTAAELQKADAAEFQRVELADGEGVETCEGGEVRVILEVDLKTKTLSRAECYTVREYADEKLRLKTMVEEPGKRFDFDINDKSLLSGILFTEIQNRGGIIIEDATKEKVRNELLNLLN